MKKFESLISKGAQIRQSNPSDALELFNDALKIARLTESDEYKAKSLFNIAITYLILGNYNASLSNFRDSLSTQYAEKDPELKSEILRGIAANLARKYNYREALKYFILSEDLSIRIWNMPNLHMVYIGMSSLYSKLHLYEKAFDYCQKSLDIAIQSGEEDPLQSSLMALGACSFKLGRLKEAKSYFDEALTFKANSFAEANTLHFISTIKYDENDLDECEKIAIRQINISSRNNYFDYEALGYRMLGNIRFKSRKFDEAVEFYKKAYDKLINVGDKSILFAVMKNMADVYEATGDKDKIIDIYSKLYKEHINHLENDVQLKVEQIDIENEAEQIKKEVEKEKENNISLQKALSEVSKLNDELKLLHDEKDNLMKILAHDLKNPIQSIMSSVKLLKGEEDPEYSEELLKNISSQAKRMQSLTKRLLEFKELENGTIKLNITEFNSRSLSEKLIKNSSLNAAKKGIAIINDCSCYGQSLRTDYEILYQILENLISNSIKFSPFGSNITIRCIKEDMKYCFEIEDEGPGFTEEDMKKLYSAFAKLSAKPTGNEHTTGLGLSIVKKLCDLLNAEIRLESYLNKGAKFTVSVTEQ